MSKLILKMLIIKVVIILVIILGIWAVKSSSTSPSYIQYERNLINSGQLAAENSVNFKN